MISKGRKERGKAWSMTGSASPFSSAREQRQAEAVTIAGMVDAMIVVGGKHSSNTQKLFDICREHCKNTYFIETLVDLETIPFQSFCHVGITAGASTPNQIIEEVQEKLCQKN